jgi:hypothetical protein
MALFGLLQDRTCFLFLPKFCGVCLLIMCGVVSFGDVFFALVDQGVGGGTHGWKHMT